MDISISNPRGFLFGIQRSVLVLLIASTWFAASSCTDSPVAVTLDVEAKDSDGKPLSGATVYVNKKSVGETGAQGRLIHKGSYAPSTKIEVKVARNSEQYYYAPYFERFETGTDAEKKSQIKALLYYVEKPGGKNKTASAPEKAVADKKATEQAKPAAEDVNTIDVTEPEAIADGSDANEKPASAEDETTVKEKIAEIEDADEIRLSESGPDLVEPASPEPVLSRVEKIAPKQLAKGVYPRIKHGNKGKTIFTIHVYSGQQPLANAEVFVGEHGRGHLKLGCKTNKRGRCVLRYRTLPKEAVTLVAKKASYLTKTAPVHLKDKGIYRFDLNQGETIDVFALQKTYNFTVGLKGVDVLVDGRVVGATDQYGHFAHSFAGKKADLLGVELKTKNALPESFSTDFVVTGPMTLVRYFSPKAPPPAKITLLDVEAAGSFKNNRLFAPSSVLNLAMRRSTKRHIFSSRVFREFSQNAFLDQAKETGRTHTEMVRRGWATTEIKGDIDVVLRPTLVEADPFMLELSMIDSRGKVIAAAKEKLESTTDSKAIDRAVSVLAKRLRASFPFEGAVMAAKDDEITLNLGNSTGRGLKSGDQVEVYGVQSSEYGDRQTFEKVATLKVTAVGNSNVSAKVVTRTPRSVISRGDLVVLKRGPITRSGRNTLVSVHGKNRGIKAAAVAQANVYFNERWIGATDADGNLYVDAKGAGGKGSLKVIKHGFRAYSQSVNFTGRRAIEVTLNRETSFLRIASEPAGATVRIDGREVGKTPIRAPLPVPSGFLKVEIGPIPGYKTYTSILELEEGTLELTGANVVKLERDLRAPALLALRAGQYDDAIKKFNLIPPNHTDYLLSRHEMGEIYLSQLKDPAKAAAAFALVTQDPSVKDFSDKRFIGSHINEGIALFSTGQNLMQSDRAAAQAHFEKAVSVLKGVQPYLRFVTKEEFRQASHNVSYYTALSNHKIWFVSGDRAYLNLAHQAWQDYLQSPASEGGVRGGFVKTARVYYKQTAALVNKKTAKR